MNDSNGYDTIESSSDLWGIGSGRGNPHAALLPGQKPTVANFVNFYQMAKASGSVATFYKACLAAGTCTETSYDSLRGDPFFQLDTRVGKTVQLQRSLQRQPVLPGLQSHEPGRTMAATTSATSPPTRRAPPSWQQRVS